MKTALFASALALGLGTATLADSIVIVGSQPDSTEGLGNFVATLDYSSPGGGVGTLVVSIDNITDPALGGKLTGFLFNFESADPAATASLVSGDYPFLFAKGKAPPFGNNFDAGAALGGNWVGGGSPANGIPPGATGTFVFSIVASDAGSLSAADFASGPYAFDFVVRFKGFDNGGSDKVPGLPTCACDLDFDGDVDNADLQLVIDAFGATGPNPYDFNGDEIVDGADLGIFLECWRDCFLASES